MTDVNFYERKIAELTEQLHESARKVCSEAADIERNVDDYNAEIVAVVMDTLAHESELVKAFADSICFLTRLLREKTKA